jgi:peptide deformylase
MALMKILRYPDPRLKIVAKPVTQFDDQLAKLASDMAETMYEAPGVGLAATQVDRHIRMLVADVSEEKNQLFVLVNPEIVGKSADSVPYEEGCLSVPGVYDEVIRPAQIRVRAQDLQGKFFELQADGLLSVCIQHEIDHLNGKVFVEYLSQLKQNRIKTKLKKQERQNV